MSASIKRKSPSLFAHDGFSSGRVMAYCLAAILLMALDQRGAYNQKIRESVLTLVSPLYLLVNWPSRLSRTIGDNFSDRQALLAENKDLTESLLKQQIQLSRLQALNDENQRLRSLLGARSGLRVRTLVAELLAVDLDPYSHRVIINRGQADGVKSGMVVLDAGGVMGQIDIANPESSEVILLSDPDHALPVEVARTGMRSLVFGSGDTAVLILPNVSINADIKAGDVLQTSGLGGLFPAGYAVARVISVERNPGRPFARVWARPMAQLERASEVLILIPEPTVNESEESPLQTGQAATPVAEPEPDIE